MANLKEVRTRISSVQSTQQITKAMKMVAASKLRKAQNAILDLRPYAQKLHELLSHISAAGASEQISPYTAKRQPEKVLLIAVSSNKGLCGPFNANVAKRTMELCNEKYNKQYKSGNLKIETFGKKVAETLNSKGFEVSEQFNDIYDELSFENVSDFAEQFMKRFVSGEYDRVELIYNQFKNAAVQILINEQFLPVEKDQEEADNNHVQDYIFEPSENYIMKTLIPDSLKIQLFKALLDSVASEHGARMTAMHKATDNADDLIKELKLTYNKARQAAITTEISEITAGSEALSD
ncbi:MAG: ATP synthase F1 subunit gamma [Bacteroidota bacterium]|nr:ATP synthase F1 subunit gamma [Bacteroidota bacterium]